MRVRETQVTGHLPPEPGRRDERSGLFLRPEFDLCKHKSGQLPFEPVYLHGEVRQRDQKPGLADTCGRSERPERIELFGRQLNLRLIPHETCSALHSQ